MKTYRMWVLVLALMVAIGLTAGAYAADAPAKAAPAKAAAGEKAAAKPAKPKVEVKCEVTGKFECKKAINKKNGKEVNRFSVTIATAKDAEGKALDALKGKTVGVGGKKGLALKGFVGKDVTIAGTLVNNKHLVPDTIK